MSLPQFLSLAEDLEIAGLIWQPSIGDEIAYRKQLESISILVDPQGLTPSELRATYLWLPSVEQLVAQFEARQAMLVHAGIELSASSMGYKVIVKSPQSQIETSAESLRSSLGCALRELLLTSNPVTVN